MRQFIVGFILGAALFGSIGVYAGAARIVGSGTVDGVTVVSTDGDEICSSVYYWSSTKELECDD